MTSHKAAGCIVLSELIPATELQAARELVSDISWLLREGRGKGLRADRIR